MRRISLALLAATALSTGAVESSLAGPAPAAATWTGFYLGGNVGYSWGNDDVTLNGLTISGTSLPGIGSSSFKPSGAIGGLQAGYNWQFAPNWLLGFETDFQWTNQKDTLTSTSTFSSSSCFGLGSPTCSVTGASGSANLIAKIDWLGTVRGRFGYVTGRTLFYGTGGLAYGRVYHSLTGSLAGTFFDSSNCEGGCAFGANVMGDGSAINVGWVLGAGVESFLPNSNNWTWRVEYLYVDLGTINETVPFSGSVTISGLGSTPIGGTASYSAHVTDQILRAALSYKF